MKGEKVKSKKQRKRRQEDKKIRCIEERDENYASTHLRLHASDNHSVFKPFNRSTIDNRVKTLLKKFISGGKVSKYKAPGFTGTFKNSFKGIRLALKSERNIRIHFVAALVAISSGIVLHFNTVEFCLLLIAIAIVIMTEMVNSAIEFTLDAIFHNRYSKLVGMAKDIAAGAVMVATFISIAIGILLFGSKLICIFAYC
ncbi:MAG: diacylglycerol kinase family protein [Candidatus Gastranaerophilales bacterium]|nr:diacylglycerol kinase family protein [Candidatus Gastranaerophilales bacterium]